MFYVLWGTTLSFSASPDAACSCALHLFKIPQVRPPLIFTYSPVRIIEIQKEYIKYRIYVLIKGKSYNASSLSDLYFFKFHLNDLYFIFYTFHF